MGHGFHGYVNLVNSQRPVQTGSPDIGNFVATKEFLLLGDGPPDAATKKPLQSDSKPLQSSTVPSDHPTWAIQTLR